MLRVYLDQAKWVDLSKYRAGRLDGAWFRDVDTVASEAVRSGHVSFVLSFAHYYETHRRRDTQSRLALVSVPTEY
ncbi:hypothetical protein ACWZHB_02905 [Nocardia sp. FBN12]|uniref:hypothetical protein n=1 Tax=Nocardia sp. FBN12 TaxID=3419766 RepID=UPI003D0951BF